MCGKWSGYLKPGLFLSVLLQQFQVTVFFSGGNDHLIKVWDYNEGEVTHVGVGHSGNITRIRVSPGNQYIISVSADGAILRWKYPFASWSNQGASPASAMTKIGVWINFSPSLDFSHLSFLFFSQNILSFNFLLSFLKYIYILKLYIKIDIRSGKICPDCNLRRCF